MIYHLHGCLEKGMHPSHALCNCRLNKVLIDLYLICSKDVFICSVVRQHFSDTEFIFLSLVLLYPTK